MSMKADLELSIRLRPKNVRTCYVCGPDNARGLQVAFLADGAHGSRALYTARPEHEGWPGLLHGGVTFSLMDEAQAGPFISMSFMESPQGLIPSSAGPFPSGCES